MQLSNKSWHFRLASTYSNLPTDPIYTETETLLTYNGDLCTYMRKVLSGFMLAFLITIVGAVCGSALLYPAFLAVAGVVSGYWELHWPPLVISALGWFWVISIIIVATGAGTRAVEAFASVINSAAMRHAGNTNTKDSFIKGVYYSFKHKMCIKLTVS